MTVESGQAPTKEQFFRQADRTFRASGPGLADVDALLVECREMVDSELQETFSLVFRVPADVPAVQGTYQLENEELGAVDLFLVPIRSDEQGLYLEALFNRLKQGAAGGHS